MGKFDNARPFPFREFVKGDCRAWIARDDIGCSAPSAPLLLQPSSKTANTEHRHNQEIRCGWAAIPQQPNLITGNRISQSKLDIARTHRPTEILRGFIDT